MTTIESESDLKKIKRYLLKAMKKIKAKEEKELCKYLPDPSKKEAIHHFTMRKMMDKNPSDFIKMLEKYILKPKKIQILPCRKRKSRKQKQSAINLTDKDFERMLEIAKITGDHEMISKLTPKKSLKDIQKELISSIRLGAVNTVLWKAYVNFIYQNEKK